MSPPETAQQSFAGYLRHATDEELATLTAIYREAVGRNQRRGDGRVERARMAARLHENRWRLIAVIRETKAREGK